MVPDLRALETERTVAVASGVGSQKVRVALSFWQSLGLLTVIFGVLLGTAGIAALGFVAASDWSCRVGLTTKYCPPPPPAPPPRAEIPA